MTRSRSVVFVLATLAALEVDRAPAAPPGPAVGPAPLFGSPAAVGSPQFSYPAPGIYGSTVFQPFAMPSLSGSGPAYNVPLPPANWRDEVTGKVTVRLPADAKLWVDGRPTKQTGAVREFVTPPVLRPGQTYQYTFRAEWAENGRRVARERAVAVAAARGGDVDLTKP